MGLDNQPLGKGEGHMLALVQMRCRNQSVRTAEEGVHTTRVALKWIYMQF